MARAGYDGLLTDKKFVLTGKLSGAANLVSRLSPQSSIPETRRKISWLLGPP